VTYELRLVLLTCVLQRFYQPRLCSRILVRDSGLLQSVALSVITSPYLSVRERLAPLFTPTKLPRPDPFTLLNEKNTVSLRYWCDNT
jgi:hypothetical protein